MWPHPPPQRKDAAQFNWKLGGEKVQIKVREGGGKERGRKGGVRVGGRERETQKEVHTCSGYFHTYRVSFGYGICPLLNPMCPLGICASHAHTTWWPPKILNRPLCPLLQKIMDETLHVHEQSHL